MFLISVLKKYNLDSDEKTFLPRRKLKLRNYIDRVDQFFTESPRITFLYESYLRLLFLIIFTYTLLCNFKYKPSEFVMSRSNTSLIKIINQNNNENIFATNAINSLAPIESDIGQSTLFEYILVLWILFLTVDEIYQV